MTLEVSRALVRVFRAKVTVFSYNCKLIASFEIVQSFFNGPMNNIGRFRSSLASRLHLRMSSNSASYEDAVRKLNKLQSNKSTIDQIRNDIKTGQKCTNLEDMARYLSRTGVSLSKLDELSVIHVAGTKGKGSTSAMCESILRHHGFRTGFYSSPHLIAVRERIRVDGRIVSEEMFAQYFHQVYDMLESTKEYKGDMPKYFAFLTVLAFNLFLKEKVDVAIIEVGIGGIVDYTNILRKVPVVGITALGLDHTSILGTTLPEIATAKAGIMKRGCEAYTVQQPLEAMDVLTSYAEDVQCHLAVVPDYKTYTFHASHQTPLPNGLEAYQMNASLAIQLAHSWIRITNVNKNRNGLKKPVNGYDNNKRTVLHDVVTDVPIETVQGLKECRWPGRYHIVETDHTSFYMDGAHTKESMEICVQWFKDNSRSQNKILIFSATGDRNAEVLLKPTKSLDFTEVYFVIPTAYKEVSQKCDNYSLVECEELIARCHRHAQIWNGFQSIATKVTVLYCVSDALRDIKLKYGNTGEKSSVLVTGSLHLVGATLSILDPDLST